MRRKAWLPSTTNQGRNCVLRVVHGRGDRLLLRHFTQVAAQFLACFMLRVRQAQCHGCWGSCSTRTWHCNLKLITPAVQRHTGTSMSGSGRHTSLKARLQRHPVPFYSKALRASTMSMAPHCLQTPFQWWHETAPPNLPQAFSIPPSLPFPLSPAAPCTPQLLILLHASNPSRAHLEHTQPIRAASAAGVAPSHKY